MKKLLSLSSKHFLTGIAPNAHTETGGVLFKADGITPLYDVGGTASIENGLLQAGPSPTDFATLGTIADAVIAGEGAVIASVAYLLMLGNAGHFYLKQVGSGDVIDRAATNQISNPANGLVVWAPAGGTIKGYYWQKTQIGTYDLSANSHPASPDSHWVDNAYTGLTSTSNHPVHKFQGNVYYGNDAYVGALLDNGAGGVTHSTNVLDFPFRLKVTAISDDGTYLVVAATENNAGNTTFANNKVVFWDGYSSQWTREFDIKDPFIWAMKKLGNTVYALGQYGIYEITFGGVRKVLSRLIGFGTLTDLASGYGANRAIVYNDGALMFATDTTVDTFGKISPDLQNAYFKHFKIPSTVGAPTFISAELDVGRIYVATKALAGTPTTFGFYGYDFNATTRNTGVSAQTVYFPLGDAYKIQRIDVIFGEPLVSGDSMNIQVKSDEDTAALTVQNENTASYAQDGAIRRKEMTIKDFTVDEQLSLIINFTAGAPKIKRIVVWGDRIPTL